MCSVVREWIAHCSATDTMSADIMPSFAPPAKAPTIHSAGLVRPANHDFPTL
ncbi:hypothetical protein OH687_18570 [Burkholderia anthina]|nr:hypothetical protein OH687_18570 [Burkholderia anthina]